MVNCLQCTVLKRNWNIVEILLANYELTIPIVHSVGNVRQSKIISMLCCLLMDVTIKITVLIQDSSVSSKLFSQKLTKHSTVRQCIYFSSLFSADVAPPRNDVMFRSNVNKDGGDFSTAKCRSFSKTSKFSTVRFKCLRWKPSAGQEVSQVRLGNGKDGKIVFGRFLLTSKSVNPEHYSARFF